MSKLAGDMVAGEVVARRRKRPKQERRAIVEEILIPGASVAVVARARAHGVNASQVLHWRQLHRQRLLEEKSAGTELVPVRIADRPVAPGRAAGERAHHHGAASRAGAIRIEIERAWVAIEGAPGPAIVRVVLGCLLG